MYLLYIYCYLTIIFKYYILFFLSQSRKLNFLLLFLKLNLIIFVSGTKLQEDRRGRRDRRSQNRSGPRM